MQRITAILLVASAATLSFLSFAQTSTAQTSSPQTAVAQTSIAPPDTGLIISYQYWPEQFVQFVGTELPYTMLELDVNHESKTPILNVMLTERATGRRVQYSNNDGLIAAATAQGNEAHKTEIAFEEADTTSVGSISTLRLTLADGKPLQWRFVQGSDVSEQGSGLTALPDVPVPVFAYRERGAVAGEGTVLEIGGVLSTAAVWTEISRPPYFVAYRGAYTESAHRVIFGAGDQSWTVTDAPATLAMGSVWKLDGSHSTHRTLTVDHVDGAHYTINGTDSLQPLVRFVLDATRTGDAWSIASVRYSPVKDAEKHAMTVRFGKPLDGTVQASTVELFAGKKTRLASGSLTLSGSAVDRTALLTMDTPTWSQGKALVEETKASGTSVETLAKLQSKP